MARNWVTLDAKRLGKFLKATGAAKTVADLKQEIPDFDKLKTVQALFSRLNSSDQSFALGLAPGATTVDGVVKYLRENNPKLARTLEG